MSTHSPTEQAKSTLAQKQRTNAIESIGLVAISPHNSRNITHHNNSLYIHMLIAQTGCQYQRCHKYSVVTLSCLSLCGLHAWQNAHLHHYTKSAQSVPSFSSAAATRSIKVKLHLFDLLWICCTTSCTTSPQQIHSKSNKWSLTITNSNLTKVNCVTTLHVCHRQSDPQEHIASVHEANRPHKAGVNLSDVPIIPK